MPILKNIILGLKRNILESYTHFYLKGTKENPSNKPLRPKPKEPNQPSIAPDRAPKIKTPWYVGLHRTLTEDVNRENVIIQYILEETIDDVISQVPAEKKSVHDRISHLITLVKREIDKKSTEIESDYLTFLQMGGDKKAFALKYLNTPNFSYVMSMTNGSSSYDLAKDCLS